MNNPYIFPDDELPSGHRASSLQLRDLFAGLAMHGFVLGNTAAE